MLQLAIACVPPEAARGEQFAPEVSTSSAQSWGRRFRLPTARPTNMVSAPTRHPTKLTPRYRSRPSLPEPAPAVSTIHQ